MGTHTYTIYSFCTLAPIQARHLEASEHDPHRDKRRAPQQWPPAGQDRTWDVEAWLVVRIFHKVKTLYNVYKLLLLLLLPQGEDLARSPVSASLASTLSSRCGDSG